MSHFENRNKIIDRIEKELIGPGSDIFLCDADFSNEIIEGKPLQRYFSAILFPKQKATDEEDNGKEFSTHPGTAGTYYTLVHIDRLKNLAYIIFTNAFNNDTIQGVRLLMKKLKENYGS